MVTYQDTTSQTSNPGSYGLSLVLPQKPINRIQSIETEIQRVHDAHNISLGPKFLGSRKFEVAVENGEN